MHYSVKLILLLLLILTGKDLPAQQNIAQIRHKKCLLKGKWQLVQTFTEGALHAVSKSDYDAVIIFKSFHHFKEEVNYESYHWAIEGKWHVYKNKATLALTERNYTLGNMGEKPVDIIFELFTLDKKNWAGSSSAKGQPVKMYYQKIHK